MATKTIPIFLPGDKIAWVMAGPTRELPDTHMLVRCAAEIPVPFDRIAFDVATGDFKPFDDQLLSWMLPMIMEYLRDDTSKPLYVGCMGGTGRTGTMLALLAAQHPGMTGIEAITYIRQIYKSGAVETQEQENQVILWASPDYPLARSTAKTRAHNPWHPRNWLGFLRG